MSTKKLVESLNPEYHQYEVIVNGLQHIIFAKNVVQAGKLALNQAGVGTVYFSDLTMTRAFGEDGEELLIDSIKVIGGGL